jgi:hypothetical protein
LKPVGFKVGATEPIRVRTHVSVDIDEDDD